MNPSMLAVALPQIEMFNAQLKDRSDVPDHVKTAAQAFVDSLKRWQKELIPDGRRSDSPTNIL